MGSASTTNLGDIFDLTAAAERTALIDCREWDNPREYTHGELDAQANACARGLIARGLEPGQSVALLSANRVEFMIAYMGILRAGLVAVPINYKFSAEIITFILADADVRLAICDAERAAALRSDVPVVCFDTDGKVSFDTLLHPGPFDVYTAIETDVAMILYTSGSTGRPKGVPLTHAGHLWALRSRLGAFDQHRLLVAAPLYHMNALCVSLVAWASKAQIVLLPEFTAYTYVAAIERFRCTWITSVPTMLAMVFVDPALTENADLSSVKIVRMGSAPVSPKLWAHVEATFPGASIMNGYGTTESGPVVFGARDGAAPPPTSVGWVIQGVGAKLIDASGNEADQGELWHKCPANSPGYLNLPEKTAEAFTEDGWYKTGDVFRRDVDGAHYFVGRTDDMFNCGGENIYPADVEAVLVSHPDIDQACVVPIPDEIKGMKPVAFAVPQAGKSIDENLVKQHALANGPAYQHPRRVLVMNELPLAGPGKVDRKGLTEKALQMWPPGTV